MGMELITGGSPSEGTGIRPTSPGRGSAPAGPDGLADGALAAGEEVRPEPACGPLSPVVPPAQPALAARAMNAAADLVAHDFPAAMGHHPASSRSSN
ncbi:hypothetical protein ACFV0L_25340 [Streptosporangium canum]|uniref:hypothetical protein n=1 Tax=Streptosporangium canum TaxID=324952 RepID=UPI0036A71138